MSILAKIWPRHFYQLTHEDVLSVLTTNHPVTAPDILYAVKDRHGLSNFWLSPSKIYLLLSQLERQGSISKVLLNPLPGSKFRRSGYVLRRPT